MDLEHIQLITVDAKGLEICANLPLAPPTTDFSTMVSPMAGQLLPHDQIVDLESHEFVVQPPARDLTSENAAGISSPMGSQLINRKSQRPKFHGLHHLSVHNPEASFGPGITSPMGAQLLQRKAHLHRPQLLVSTTEVADESTAPLSSPMGCQLMMRKAQQHRPQLNVSTTEVADEATAPLSSPMGCQLMKRKAQQHKPQLVVSTTEVADESTAPISSPMGCQLMMRKAQQHKPPQLVVSTLESEEISPQSPQQTVVVELPLENEASAAVSSPMGCQLMRRKARQNKFDTKGVQSESSCTISSPMGCQLMKRKQERSKVIPGIQQTAAPCETAQVV